MVVRLLAAVVVFVVYSRHPYTYGQAVEPSFSQLRIGETLQLNCTPPDDSFSDYQWLKNGYPISSQNTSTLNVTVNNATADGGTYTCVVTNATGNGSASATVYVTPIIITQPSDMLAVVNGNVTLMCEAEAFPPPQYIWEHIGGNLAGRSNVIGINSNRLDFNGVMFGDEGSYICKVTSNGTMVASRTATVTLSPSTGVTVTPSSTTVPVNATVILNCSGLGGPGNTYRWSSGQTTPTLQLNVTNGTSDGGTYTCVVTNAAGNGSASATVYVTPTIITQPSDMLAVVNDIVTLMCEAEAFPPPQYIWEHIGGNLAGRSNVMGINSNSLKLNGIVFGDEGSYRCSATSNGTTVVSRNAIVTLSPSTGVTVTPSSTTVPVNATVILNCSGLGGPGNTYRWSSGQTTPTLQLNVTNGTSDGGTYTCVVTNAAGNGSASATVYVTPTIITQPSDVLAVVNGNVTLMCGAEAFPPPQYIWEHIGGNLAGRSNVMGINSNSLKLNGIVFGDEGSYRCSATSNGTTVVSRNAIVTLSPSTGVTVTPSSTTVPVNATVILNCSGLGGPGNTYRWSSGQTTPTLQLNVTNGTSDGGTYTCVVTNAAGNGSASATVYVTPTIITQPSDMLAVVNDIVTLMCEAEAFPPPQYIWEHIGGNLAGRSNVMGINSNSLKLNGIVFGDEGSYRCSATSNGTTVVSRNAFVTFAPSSTTVPVNATVILNCSGLGGPGNTYRWSSGQTTPTLQLNVTNGTSDGGTYTCVVTNAAGNGSASATVYVTPTIITQPSDVLAVVNGNVTLMCGAEAFPPPQYTWEHIGGNLTGRSNVIGINSNRLEINGIVFGDEGSYRCSATSNGTTVVSRNAIVTLSPSTGVTVTPLSTTVPVNATVILNCSGLGGPGNTYRWSSGQTTPTLQLNVTNGTSDGGVYTCVVTNAAGNGSASATVYVTPTIITQPSDMLAVVNGNVTLMCEAEAFPPPQYIWEHIGGNLAGRSNVMGINSNNLKLNSIVFGDEGSYRCNATSNGTTVVSRNAIVTLSPLTGVTVAPSSTTVPVNATVILNCSGLGGPGNTYRWSSGQTTPTLQLNVTNGTSDGGVYTCVVTNAAGNGSASATVYVTPTIITQPSDVLAVVNDIVTLMCEAEAFPPPQYIWEHIGGNLAGRSNVMGINSNSLKINGIVFGDEGSYRCSATSNGTTVVSRNAIVTLSPSTGVTVTPSSTTVPVNATVILNCSGLGGPGNTYRWSSGQTTPTLQLNVTNGTSDGGTYTCVVTNAAGNGSASATVYVTPTIITQPSDVLAVVNGNVTLMCEAEAFPPPQYIWEHIGGNLAGRSNVMGINSNSLKLNGIVFGDEGSYRCSATSNGTTVVSRNAIVTLSPSTGVTVAPSSTTVPVNATVILNCSGLGGPGNTYRWSSGQTTPTLQLNVTNGTSDGGTYTCVVTNAAGNGSASATVYVTPTIITQPSDMLAVVNGNVTLMCEAEAFPPPQYIWEHIGGNLAGRSNVMGINSNNLKLNGIVFGDEGSYRCSATSNGTTVVSRNAIVTLSPLTGVTVAPSSTTVAVNATVILNCSGLGGPGNTYRWSSGQTTPTLQLNVTNGTSDGGTYTCVVTNAAGNGSASASVYVTPTIITQPSDMLAVVNDNVTLMCEAEAFPPPQYIWEHIGGNLAGRSKVMGINSNSLKLNGIVFGDEGSYRCNATSNGTTVVSRNAIVTLSPSTGVTVAPSSTTVPVNATVILNCSGLGGPGNTYRWSSGQTTPTLQLNVTNGTSDGGTYTCVVTNAAGNGSASATVYVTPTIITQPSDVLAVVNDILTLVCEAEAFPPPQYIWEHIGGNLTGRSNVMGINSNRLKLNGVYFGDEGIYICKVTSNGSMVISRIATISCKSLIFYMQTNYGITF
ncbi:hypothetical protein EMCRGX_G018829 [Ephydatia muelleri]